ncbi:glycosyltransferase family 2 protein [candidate division TA06 bacterium]|uniref:Glycosyltransferase family 2 protein n=1 Tax=candidate division TA06 bacterium TaxID=2250710 RepID=A0A933IF08_UNCT6|nr:glycosyltransferase family 2 protein [candidate division TA06 bacterium]
MKISATVITKNEEVNIERCLKSLSFADEIVLVDSQSSDQTVRLAEAYASRVITNPWPGHIQQKNFAIGQAAGDWILSLDADEEITPELKNEILQAKQNGFYGRAGFYFPRQSMFLGRWMKHGGWYPDYHLRLFKKESGRFGGMNPHDKVILNGRAGHFKNHLLHYTYPSLESYFSRFNSYTGIAARELFNHGRRPSLAQLLFSPPAAFVKMYLLKLGFLDGLEGLMLSVFSACYVLVKDLKLWELEKSEGNG